MGIHFKHPLVREIAVILATKLVAIAAIAYYFFGPDTKPKVDDSSVAKAVLERPVATSPTPDNRSAK